MNKAALDYIWQAIQESERSGESRFMDYELLVKAAATYFMQQRLEQSDTADSESTAEAAIGPKPADSDLLQAVTPPPLAEAIMAASPGQAVCHPNFGIRANCYSIDAQGG